MNGSTTVGSVPASSQGNVTRIERLKIGQRRLVAVEAGVRLLVLRRRHPLVLLLEKHLLVEDLRNLGADLKLEGVEARNSAERRDVYFSKALRFLKNR